MFWGMGLYGLWFEVLVLRGLGLMAWVFIFRVLNLGVSENTGPYYSTLNTRILIIRTPKIRYPLISETPIWRYLEIYAFS